APANAAFAPGAHARHVPPAGATPAARPTRPVHGVGVHPPARSGMERHGRSILGRPADGSRIHACLRARHDHAPPRRPGRHMDAVRADRRRRARVPRARLLALAADGAQLRRQLSERRMLNAPGILQPTVAPYHFIGYGPWTQVLWKRTLETTIKRSGR